MMRIFVVKGSVLGLLALTLSACAPLAQRSQAPASTVPATVTRPAKPGRASTLPTPSVRPAAPSGPAVVALLQQAQHEEHAGHMDRSDAILERALHIEPHNPQIWYRMAQVRLQQGRAAQAEAFALKCISLSRANRKLQARAWALIAAARQAHGDVEGSAAAHAKSAALERRP